MSDEIVDFDEYVDNYEALLENQLSFFNSALDYFSAYKIELLKKNLSETPKRILDFGCGIGLNLPHLIQAFPESEIFVTDISEKSLDHVRQNYPNVKVLQNPQEAAEKFDLIFLAGVMHHVPPRQRLQVLGQIKNLSPPLGIICIFEHNPFNPVTRRLVSNCPFDKGVVLLPQKELKNLMKKAAIETYRAEYCLFFPHILQFMRPIERFVKWLPIGGQYFVMGKHPKREHEREALSASKASGR